MMSPTDHYQAARLLAQALQAIHKVSPWCRTIRAEREVLKCVVKLKRAFEGSYPGMRNPYLEIP